VIMGKNVRKVHHGSLVRYTRLMTGGGMKKQEDYGPLVIFFFELGQLCVN